MPFPAKGPYNGQVAQLVEQWTENPRVGSSILSLATTFHLLNRYLARVTSTAGVVGLFELLVVLPITDEVNEGGS